MRRAMGFFFRLFFTTAAVCLSVQTFSSAEPLYKGKITIGTAIWPGYLGLYVAGEKGFFKEAGLDVDVTLGAGLAELSKDYVAGKMQGRANLVFDALKEQAGGFDQKAVLVIDYSNGSDAILARPGIASIQDFKGKRVGYEFGTLEEFFLTWALAENGMEFSDIVAVDANPEDAAKMLSDGKVDVAVSYEPFVSKYVSSGNFHVVYSSVDAPGLITDILTFRTDFVEAYPETIRAIIQAYFKALDFWKTHPEEAHAILAKDFKDTPESVAGQIKGVKILDKRDNETAFTFSTGLQSLYGNVRQISQFIHKHSSSSSPQLDSNKLIERKFIKQVND
jgi:NitT/TauT family transport system substrate-binding protein